MQLLRQIPRPEAPVSASNKMLHGIRSKQTHICSEHTHCGGGEEEQRFEVILTTHKFEASLDYETLEGKRVGEGHEGLSPHIFLWFWVYMCARLLCVFM